MQKPASHPRTPPSRTAPTARLLAVRILGRIETAGGHAEPLLDAALTEHGRLTPPDRGLLTELVYGTLRMQGHLDWIIGRFYRGNQDVLEPAVRNTLRTAVYQLRFCDRIPPFAAVDEAVRTVKALRPAAAGLVNAVLRNVLRGADALTWPDMDSDPAASIAARHSHPRWLVQRWLADLGVAETEALCRADNLVPPLTVRVNTLKATRDEARASLAAEGIGAEPAPLSPDGLVLTSPGSLLRKTAAYRAGLVRIQDEASQLVSRLVAPEPGERILDLCAGAGGKTLHLAALMGNRGRITAIDLHADRLAGLREDAGRLGVTNVETCTGDAAHLPAVFSGAFDRVLLDAPCSGLGTLRRNPEIRWRIGPAEIARCGQAQRRLLAGAAQCLRPGGRLVYSVCTVTPEENEQVVAALLASRPDFLPLRPVGTEGIPPLVTEAGWLKTFPHRHGADGFFAAVFARRQ